MTGAQYRAFGNGNIQFGEADIVATTADTPQDGSRTAVIYCHSGGAYGYEVFGYGQGGVAYLKTVQELLRQNVMVISSDLGGTSTWGNDESLNRITQCHQYAVDQFGANPDRVLLLGASMGTATALNYAQAHPDKVAATTSFFPLIDQNDSALTAYAGVMNAAYGSEAARTAALPTHNPKNYAAGFATPTLLFYSDNDTITRPQPVQDFAAAATNTTAVRLTANGGHFDSGVSDAEIKQAVDFLVSRSR